MKSRRSKTKIIVSIIVILAFSGVIALGLYQSQSQITPQKKPAAEYFQVVSAAIEPTGKERIEQNGTLWIIYGITFSFKPVGGDGHDVIVKSWAKSEAEEIGILLKNQPRTVTLLSPDGYLSRQNAEGNFTVKVNIDSREAEGFLTLILNP